MNLQHRFLVPPHIGIALRQIGLQEEFVLWQHATDFLREKYGTHIVISPVESEDHDQIEFSFYILSPYGQDWENDDRYADYYDALAEAIEESINSIKESHEPGYIR